jgi:hypothetical protein
MYAKCYKMHGKVFCWLNSIWDKLVTLLKCPSLGRTHFSSSWHTVYLHESKLLQNSIPLLSENLKNRPRVHGMHSNVAEALSPLHGTI